MNLPPSYSESSHPPSYEPGTTVRKLPNFNDRQIAWIELDGPCSRILEPGSVVSGKALFNPTMGIKFSSIVVELSMVESVAKSKAYGQSRITRNVILEKYPVPEQCLPEDHKLERSYEYGYKFSMVIPEFMPVSACHDNISEHFKLPPCIGGTSKKPELVEEGGIDFPARITYRVTAKVYGEERPIITAYDNLRLFPSYLANVNEFSGKFESGNELKQGLIRKSSIGCCKLSIDNPPIINLTMKIPFVFNLQVNYTPVNNETEPSKIQRVSYKLQAHTMVSTKNLNKIPDINDSQCDTCTQVLTNQRIEGPKLDWKIGEEYSIGKTNIKSYSTTIPLPLVLPDISTNKQLVAEFSTCRTSRKYSLFITVHFGSYASTCLTVPVSVTATPTSFLSNAQLDSYKYVNTTASTFNSTNNNTASSSSAAPSGTISSHTRARRSTFGSTPPHYESVYPFSSTNTHDARDGQVTGLRR